MQRSVGGFQAGKAFLMESEKLMGDYEGFEAVESGSGASESETPGRIGDR